jgi:hypothetical protein
MARGPVRAFLRSCYIVDGFKISASSRRRKILCAHQLTIVQSVANDRAAKFLRGHDLLDREISKIQKRND